MRNTSQHIRLQVGTAATAMLLAALCCARAQAREVVHRFTGTHSGGVRALGAGEQEFAFAPFMINCKKAKALKSASIAFPSPKLYIQASFGGCSTGAVTLGKTKVPAGKAVFQTGFDIEYYASGYAEIGAGSTSTRELLGAKPITIAPGDGSECTISLPVQTVPAGVQKKPFGTYEAALYEDIEMKTEKKGFPGGVQGLLMIASAFGKLTYSLTGGDCEGLGRSEEKTGSYAGRLLAELSNADLGWE